MLIYKTIFHLFLFSDEKCDKPPALLLTKLWKAFTPLAIHEHSGERFIEVGKSIRSSNCKFLALSTLSMFS